MRRSITFLIHTRLINFMEKYDKFKLNHTVSPTKKLHNIVKNTNPFRMSNKHINVI
jgi:hypothetical protein